MTQPANASGASGGANVDLADVALEHTGAGGALPESPKVLVIETGLVGELLVVTPALRALKRAYPDASISVMVSPQSAAVLAGNPAVSRLLPLRKRERTGLGLFRVASWIRSERFDAILVLHTSFRSALMAALGRGRIRAGLSCEGRGWLLNRSVPRDRTAYEVDEHLRVAALLGVPPAGRELDLFLTDEEREKAAEILEPVTPAGVLPLVALHPGASREIRRWPAERFAELGSRAEATGVARPFYVVGPRERGLAATVRDWYEREGHASPTIIEPPSVRMLGALFERATAVVTNNTGPMHVAAAVGTPGVFIHGPTPVDRWHPPGPQNEAVFGDVPCRPCDAPTCRMESLLCMEAVEVEQVYDALLRVVEDAVRARYAEPPDGGGTSGGGMRGGSPGAPGRPASAPAGRTNGGADVRR